jgi:peptide deformylase
MVRPILQQGDERLNTSSIAIRQEDAATLALLQTDLEDTLHYVMLGHVFRNSAGISAVQIGVLWRACLIWTPANGFLQVVNPTA